MPIGEKQRQSGVHVLPAVPTPTRAAQNFRKFSYRGLHCCYLFRSNWLLQKLTTAILLLMTTKPTDGTCNEEQIETCRESALEGSLTSLKGGGQCSPKRYAEFSHLCSVTNYLPNVEHCCCVYDSSVLCCRYHQDWNLFRCQMDDDVIDTTSGIIDHLSEDEMESSVCCPPLEFLLPAVLVPLFVVVCCVYVCLRHWKQCSADSIVCSSSQADDNFTSINPRKNRKNKGCIDVAYSSSLTSSDANSVHPLTHNGGPPSALALTPALALGPTDNAATLCPPPSINSTGTVTIANAGQSTSIFTYEEEEDDPYFPGIRRFHPPTVEPTAPPLFHDPSPSPSRAFDQEPNCDEFYSGARYRDLGGRLRPLYRTPRSNFSSSGGRSGGVLGPLVHRANGGGHGHGHRAGKHDRCAIYRTPGSYAMREDSVSPPPPSYEQSCNQKS